MNFQPDCSFIREGKPLEEWLWLLLDESASVRIHAGEVLQAMEWGMPSAHTDFEDMAEMPDVESQSPRFAAHLKEVVGGADFDSAQFVEKLGAFKLACSRDWNQRVRKTCTQTSVRDGKYHRIAERLLTTINSTTDSDEKGTAESRLAKLNAAYWRGGCDVDNNIFQGAEAAAASGFAANRVFDLLDQELLAAPSVLEALLSESQLRHQALSAIERIGPASAQFADRLINDIDRQLDEDNASHWFDGAGALGSVGRDNPAIVQRMIDRLTHDSSIIRCSAASVLEHIGLSVCDRHEEICNLLLSLLDNDEDCCAAVLALASVGRDFAAVRNRVLMLAQPREAKLRTYADYEDTQYDLTMQERGVAISAMKYLTSYPEECVPVLVEALDSFEEYDPDHGYHGPHARVADVVAMFGESASAAVVPLANHLQDDPDEMPSSILEALASIGPAASAAIPALHDLRERFSEYFSDETELFDKSDNPVGWTIQQIEGTPEE